VHLSTLWQIAKTATVAAVDEQVAEGSPAHTLQAHVKSRLVQLLPEGIELFLPLTRAISSLGMLLKEDHVVRLIGLRSSISAAAKANASPELAAEQLKLAGHYD
jgi:hypothetical protein